MLSELTVSGLHASLVTRLTGFPLDTAILDIGCGTGAWLSRLQSMGFRHLHGIDRGPGPELPGISYVQANLDAAHIGFGELRFGLITCIEVIEHLENYGSLLDLVSRTLSAEGRLLLTTPNLQSLAFRLKFLLKGRMPSFDDKGDPTHVTPILLDALSRSIERRGLALEATWTYPLRGTHIFAGPMKVLTSCARLLARDPLPGDCLCLLIRRKSEVPS